MNRRDFLSNAATAAAVALLGIPLASTRPVTLIGQHVAEDTLHGLPLGSILQDCRLDISGELPLGVHYWNCHIAATKDFQGRALLYAEAPKDAWEAHVQDNTSAIGCYFDGRNVPHLYRRAA